jgi:phosphoglycolate phosphatase-like HAD superfamily hydrolase
MTNLAKIKICIFDVNGVLIDSNLGNAKAMAQAFTDEPSVQEKIVRLYLKLTGIDRGNKIRTIQDQVFGTSFKEGEFDLRWERFTSLGRLAMLQAPLIEGCEEILREIGRRRITRAALSNTPRAELQQTLRAHQLESLLDIVRGGGDWPKSESLKQFLLEFPFALDSCLFFGDGKGDLAAARSAGVLFVAIDRDTGEFDNEEGFAGPYPSLAHWGRAVMGPRGGRDKDSGEGNRTIYSQE